MSKIIDSFFKTTEKPEMGRSGKVIYTLLGLIGTAFLIQPITQKTNCCTRLVLQQGILGMVAVGSCHSASAKSAEGIYAHMASPGYCHCFCVDTSAMHLDQGHNGIKLRRGP